MTERHRENSARRLTFPPALRMRSRLAFARVYDAGQAHRTGPLVFFARPNDTASSRLGLSVGRRVGNAVQRNRIKRLLREAMRLQQHDLPAGYDVVVNVRPHQPLPLAEYQQCLASALRVLDQRWKSRRNNPRRLPN